MRKRLAAVMLILTAVLFSGCGEQTLEEKTAEVQKANTIEVQDVIDLMELEGLQVEKITPSADFRKQWPDGVLVKINDTHYMALQSFEENLYNRESVLRDIKWKGDWGIFHSNPEEPLTAVQQIVKDYLQAEEGTFYYAYTLTGKNIVALLVFDYPDTINEMTLEEQKALAEVYNQTLTDVKRVFYKDINGMVTADVAAESENFKITGTLYYYCMGVVDENAKKEWTYYDARSWLDYEVVCSDAIWEQYQGVEYEVHVEDPDGWDYGHGSSSLHSVLEYEDKKLSMPNCNTKGILWKAPDGPPVYVITITIGDITETFRLEPVTES